MKDDEEPLGKVSVVHLSSLDTGTLRPSTEGFRVTHRRTFEVKSPLNPPCFPLYLLFH